MADLGMTSDSEQRETLAKVIADAQNVPFVGPKQRAIAVAILNKGYVKPDPDEWEYTWGGESWALDAWFDDIARAEQYATRARELYEDARIVRRRKPGPWEVIPDAE